MIFWNGVGLRREDFGDGLQAWIAFKLAHLCATHCRDREAALELLYEEAGEIMSLVNNRPSTYAGPPGRPGGGGSRAN